MARRREIDAILVWKLDRFGRSMADLVMTSLDFSTPSGRAMAGMLSTLAEFERDIIRERVKAGIASAQEKGKPHGRPQTASKKKDEVIKLWNKGKGLNKSQIAKKVKISRASVISFLK